MSEQIVTKPIIKDETGQQMLDKLDEIISALNQNAQGVSFDKTECEIITANNAQDALTQLDTAVDSVSSNLANLIKRGTHSTAIQQNGSFNIGTYIPNWNSSKFIIVNFRRYGNVASAVIATDIVTSGSATNAIYFYYGNSINYFTIATDGTLTMKSAIADAVYTDITCIF